MRYILYYMLISCLFIPVACRITSNETTNMQINWNTLPDLPGPGGMPFTGVSAPFAGIHNNKLIVAGGCNFPDKPPYEGGRKVFYSFVYWLDLEKKTSHGWQPAGELSRPVAYGATVSTPHGIICIGGTDETCSFPDVCRLYWEEETQTIRQEPLPSLPVTLDNMAATYVDGKVIVAGGNENGTPSNRVWLLDLQTGDGWETLPAFPGHGRVQPVLAAHSFPDTYLLYLGSGFSPLSGTTPAEVATDLWKYDSLTGIWEKETGFTSPEPTPLTFTGGSAFFYGQHQLVFAGGVNYPVFSRALNFKILLQQAEESGEEEQVNGILEEMNSYMRHPIEWYQFNSRIYLYDIEHKTWQWSEPSGQAARAGAGMVMQDNSLFIINGELKPGVRTPVVHQALFIAD
ncbi:MAG: cyclically-permuted mutarotase family protein [Tannerellaceae bacterium]|nr:cyclically-permuted mutarotase family protein [Tannerellaceae bacterium]